MPEIVKTGAVKVKHTCDQLITWGFRCVNEATYLVKNNDKPPEYAIMCDKHKEEFNAFFRTGNYSYFPWTLELNRKFADESLAFWDDIKKQGDKQ